MQRSVSILLVILLVARFASSFILPSNYANNAFRVMTKRKATDDANALSTLSTYTTIVADTGDISAIKAHSPTDATTNPSLIYKAALLPAYGKTVEEAVEKGKTLEGALDWLSCLIGKEISELVPGYVSTEVDARLSFDTDATVAKARTLISIYEQLGVPKSRILIKIAATWEGIQACRVLEAEGVTCNLTLIFSLVQAAACADAGATLISPFVGRIMDWHKKASGVEGFEAKDDPGVKSVTRIYNYFKARGITTICMGASFRNAGEILELCGCDRLTISPKLLTELEAMPSEGVVPHLSPTGCTKGPDVDTSEAGFRWAMNEDAMATEKLAEGIRGFARDLEKLEEVIKGKM
mmetsp:Transcript_28526/g.57075  ORF Transcript_28526/g.57075 Transcript_28526/m.57075 type:complete len:353 (+) Transcript_28526:177-1235(+)